MSTLDLSALRAKALAATPGPWKWDLSLGGCYHWLAGSNGAKILSDGSYGGDFAPKIEVEGPDGVYIAAANPATMLALLDEIERLRKALRLAVEMVDRVATFSNHPLERKFGAERLAEIRKVMGDDQ